jgi:hypothetical protein
MDILNMITSSLDQVKDSYDNVCKAKLLLNLEPGNPEKLINIEEDIQGLKEVWTELG